MMQGDQYRIPFQIKMNGTVSNDTDFDDVEIYIGDIRKTMSAGEIVYNDEMQAFLFPVTQDETQKLSDGRQPVQVRVKKKSGDVIGASLPKQYIFYAKSREVL